MTFYEKRVFNIDLTVYDVYPSMNGMLQQQPWAIKSSTSQQRIKKYLQYEILTTNIKRRRHKDLRKVFEARTEDRKFNFVDRLQLNAPI